MSSKFDVAFFVYHAIIRLSLVRFTCIFFCFTKIYVTSNASQNRVRRLCVTTVMKLHGVLEIATKSYIFLHKLIKGIFRLIAICGFLKLNNA